MEQFFQPRARGHKMSVWITDASDEPSIMRIGRKIKERLSLQEPIFFQPVSDQKTYTRGRDINTGRYQV